MRAFIEAINTYLEHVLDVALDHTGCLIGSLVAIVILALVLGIGLIAYDGYIHRNQHCVLAHREYVLVGKVLTEEDVCDTWQNN